MSRDETMYLRDMVLACDKILRYAEGLSQADLLRDEKTFDAVVRNLEIVGEAAKHVSEALRQTLPQVEWRKVAGMRDMLIHGYFGIDEDILWDVVRNKIPVLSGHLKEYLNRRKEL